MNAALIAVAGALALLPAVVTASFHLNALILVFLFGTVAQAWNILGGYAGQLSFGHTVFFGLGAYTSSVLLTKIALSPWVGASAGAVVAIVVALVIGTPTFRLRRHFFALATLALGEIARITFLNWPFVGAATGLSLPLQYRNVLASMMWTSKPPYYYLALALLIAVTVTAAVVDRGRMGPYLKAINQDEDEARALGLHVLRYKQWAIAASAAFTALAGSVYAQYVLYIDPYNVLTARISLLVVVIALIGGRGTVWGPALGAGFIILLSEYSRSTLGYLGGGYDFILFGLLIMLLSLYEPKGLVGLAQRLRPRLWPEIAGGAGPSDASASPFTAAASAATPALLSIDDLTKRFGGIVALDQVTLTVRPGEILGLIGPNGAGKSTLFDCVTGVQRPTSGTVRFKGMRLARTPTHRIVQRGLGRTFQLIRVFPDLTVWENMVVAQPHASETVWAALRRTSPRVTMRTERLLHLVGLLVHRDVPAAELSYGQQKLLSFAMVLATGAEIILLDEPTAGINPSLIRDLIAYIRELNTQGFTFVIIEHNMEVINALAHRVYFMADGRILAEGTPLQIRQNPQVLEAYYGR